MIITNLSTLRNQNIDVSIEEGREIIKKLEYELKNSKVSGVGLAAPQIAINKKVAIVRAYGEKIDLINPKIIEKENGFVNFNEGCLSIPNIKVNTWRYRELFVKTDLYPKGFVCYGNIAVIIQHEIDHLESILMIDRSVGKGKINRNDPCPCGKTINNKPVKWKKCHGKEL